MKLDCSLLERGFALVIVSALLLHGQLLAQDKDVVETILRQRKDKDIEFRNSRESLLDRKELRKFGGLAYFPIDLKYHVKATLVKNETPVLFKMPTTSSRQPEYVKYGDVTFTLDGHQYVLEVFQSPEISKRPGYDDYLFIPFTDETNGNETYNVGRYLDFKIPDSAEISLDFNLAYNPYCSYSDRYSCPIPPEANHLPIEIWAGEKKYKRARH
jgi:uncharacterized protein